MSAAPPPWGSQEGSPLPFEAGLASPGRRARELVRGAIGRLTRPVGSIVRVATAEPAIALTFDDGPHPEDTPAVLELLERHGARGTFFLVGANARRHPQVVERVLAGGHAVGNHTLDHLSLRRVRGAERRAQIAGAAAAIGPRAAPLLRPPFGELSLGARLDAARCGHEVVVWDVVAEDWRDDPAETLLARMLRRLRRGSIVLLHDTLFAVTAERFRDRRPMREALEALLDRLAGRYRFVTLPELLRLGRPVRWPHLYRMPESYRRQLEGTTGGPPAERRLP